ncbi:MAG: N-acetylmuramidase family protein [Prevotellaceae bacterium]|jgi:hypothetical protein|nr:N-acetylmuramidase family protein [Prevotellaceae bacterium]
METTNKLTQADFEKVAKLLAVEVAAVKAVQEVETGGRGGFFAPAKPTILFEGHIFWSQLKKRGINPEQHQTGNEDVLYPKWTKEHYGNKVEEYNRLDKARQINEDAALCSASWGMFQLMGFNHTLCEFSTVQKFVDAMSKGELEQLDAFARFMINSKLVPFLREKDWAGFAQRYNGPAYAQNKYDEKLERAYQKHKQA